MKRIGNRVKYSNSHNGINITVMGRNLKDCARRYRNIVTKINSGYYQEKIDNMANTY